MSLYKVGASRTQLTLEQRMGQKQRPYYHPNIHNYTIHPESNENQENHRPEFFTNYVRSPFPDEIKFVKDPSIKSKAYYKELECQRREEAAYVAKLDENEESEEIVLDTSKLPKKPAGKK